MPRHTRREALQSMAGLAGLAVLRRNHAMAAPEAAAAKPPNFLIPSFDPLDQL